MISTSKTKSLSHQPLKASAGYTFGYCHFCWDILDDPYKYWTAESKNGFSHWKRHAQGTHTKKKDVFEECNVCGKTFKETSHTGRRMGKHHCTKAKESDAPFTNYKIRTVGTALQELTCEMRKSLDLDDPDITPSTPLTPLQLYKLCYHERLCIANAYPGLYCKGQKDVSFEEYGNVRGIDFYKAVLTEKLQNGGQNQIKIHKNIRVLDDGNTEIFRLTENILNPCAPNRLDSVHLTAEPDPSDNEVCLLHLRRPEEATPKDRKQDLDDCKELKRYFRWQKGQPDCRFAPHRYPLTPEKNFTKPHRLPEQELRLVEAKILYCIYLFIVGQVN